MSKQANTSGETARKATVRAPSNIAFIKYWGAKNLKKALPANPSISMTLRECTSRSTVEHLDEAGEHEVLWRSDGGFTPAPPAFAERVIQHLDRLLKLTGCGGRFRVATENSFPSAAGLASSASGFAALTLATLEALGREASPAERSALARASGSGSASRSVMGGYVEWPAEGADAEPGVECHAYQLHPAEHWRLSNVIAVVETGAKEVSSLDGHRRARSSPYWRTRQRRLPARLRAVRRALEERDFELLGSVVEAEAIDLHCVAMTSRPPVFYWRPATLTVLETVRTLRRDGISAWSTMDAGANVHVICQPADEAAVARRLKALGGVVQVIRDGTGDGPVVEEEHLL